MKICQIFCHFFHKYSCHRARILVFFENAFFILVSYVIYLFQSIIDNFCEVVLTCCEHGVSELSLPSQILLVLTEIVGVWLLTAKKHKYGYPKILVTTSFFVISSLVLCLKLV